MKSINLNKREKYAVFVAAGCILIFIILKVVVLPIMNKRERLSRELAAKTVSLEEIQALQAEYFSIEKQADHATVLLAKREKDFSLYRFLDSLASDIGIEVSSIKSDTSFKDDGDTEIAIIQLELKAVTSEKLTQYLHNVEYSGNNLNVKRMTISEKDGYLDVSLQVETIEA